jgi:hypothetical protein
MTTRTLIAAVAAGAVIVGLGGAVAIAQSAGAPVPSSPVQVGPSADLPEPGDAPDQPGQ